MNRRLLIDAMVRQTTLLLASLSTAPGARAPLGHLADQVFLDLARSIERAGVGRKVAADMFGMSLRSFQKRLNRLTAAEGQTNALLWDSVLDYIDHADGTSRTALLGHFHQESAAQIGATLRDLISAGLVERVGRASATRYVRTQGSTEANTPRSAALAWLVHAVLARSLPLAIPELSERLPASETELDDAGEALVAAGKAVAEDGRYRSPTLSIPVGAPEGWETAIFDHYRAVCEAIAKKVSAGRRRSSGADVDGGATLSFALGPEHPYREQVEGLLAETRERVNGLWDEVHAYNKEHPQHSEPNWDLVFYFGQFRRANAARTDPAE